MKKIKLAVEVAVEIAQEVFYNPKTEKFTNVSEGNIRWESAYFLEDGADIVMVCYYTPLLLDQIKKDSEPIKEEKSNPRSKYEKENTEKVKKYDEEKVG